MSSGGSYEIAGTATPLAPVLTSADETPAGRVEASGEEEAPAGQVEASSEEEEGSTSQMEASSEDEALAGSAAMTAAIDATLRAAPSSEGEPPSAEVVAAARERVRAMLEATSAEDAAGLRDMHNLTLTFGLPATRAIFRQMVKASGRRGAAKRAAVREINEFSPITEVGCMQVDFYNQATQRPDVAYLMLEQCQQGHDLGAQLDKIKPFVLPARWPEVLKHLSMLVYLGRSVYANVARQHLPLIRSLAGLPADDPCERYLNLQVDPVNTTLYLDASWPGRVGIFVRLAAETDGAAK